MKKLAEAEYLDKILVGDALATLRRLPDETAFTVVTSPFYWGLRDYGVKGQLGLERTPEEFVKNIVRIFREVRRVLREDGTLWLNMGDSYNAAGREGHGSRVGFKQGTNRASAAGKDNCRPSAPDLKPKDLIGMPWRLAFALQSDGWYLRADIIWSKPNPMPESVTDRPTKAHEYIFLLAKSEKYYYNGDVIREPHKDINFRDGAYRGNGVNESDWTPRKKDGLARPSINTKNRNYNPAGRNKRSVWEIPSFPMSEAHFATFPPDLIKPCILAGAPKGNIVLDPFIGAGTTALVSAQYQRHFIGIELNPEYAEMARRRVAPELAQEKLF